MVLKLIVLLLVVVGCTAQDPFIPCGSKIDITTDNGGVSVSYEFGTATSQDAIRFTVINTGVGDYWGALGFRYVGVDGNMNGIYAVAWDSVGSSVWDLKVINGIPAFTPLLEPFPARDVKTESFSSGSGVVTTTFWRLLDTSDTVNDIILSASNFVIITATGRGSIMTMSGHGATGRAKVIATLVPCDATSTPATLGPATQPDFIPCSASVSGVFNNSEMSLNYEFGSSSAGQDAIRFTISNTGTGTFWGALGFRVPGNTNMSNIYPIGWDSTGTAVQDMQLINGFPVGSPPLEFHPTKDVTTESFTYSGGTVFATFWRHLNTGDPANDLILGSGDVEVVFATGSGVVHNMSYHGLTGRVKALITLDTCSPSPTDAPTSIPATHVPTALPTAEPTAIPTTIPTAVPTALPTVEPTAMPTVVPTAEPTAMPTVVPTAEPTAMPTTIPWTVPTALPTSIPTPLSTVVPTAEPTAIPTAIPTAVPTALPTAEPTAIPTTIPTTVPTALPTSIPTPLSTVVPTAEPTAIPTAIPTTVPKSLPTSIPTAVTVIPTALPTTVPTAIPTAFPTTALPTALSIAVPTSIPTTVPTVIPTALPTAVPTALPTTIPTASAASTTAPTTVPTVVSSAIPTTVPTFVTAVPTAIQTKAFPTTSPTAVPTNAPTAIPTIVVMDTASPPKPTVPPTAVPTTEPTAIPTTVVMDTAAPPKPTPVPSTAIPTVAPIRTATPSSGSTALPSTDVPTSIPTYAAVTSTPLIIPTMIPVRLPTTTPPTTSLTVIPTSETIYLPTFAPSDSPDTSRMTESAVKVKKGSEKVAAGGGAVVAVSSLLGAGGSSSIPGQTLIVESLNCSGDHDDAENLPLIVHPLVFRINGYTQAGCVVGNTLLSVGYFLFFYAVVQLLTYLGYGTRTSDPSVSPWERACAIVRYPSVTVPPPLFLLPGTLEASLDILFCPRGGPVVIGIACLGLLNSVIIFAILWKTSSTDKATLETFHPTSRWHGYFIGCKSWESTGYLFVERHGVTFDIYNKLPWVRGKYFAIETATVFPIAIIASARSGLWVACSIKALSLAILIAMLLYITIVCNVFIAPFLKHLMAFIYTAMILGLGCHVIAFVNESMQHYSIEIGLYFFIAAMAGSIIRAIYDVITFCMDMYNGYRLCDHSRRSSCNKEVQLLIDSAAELQEITSKASFSEEPLVSSPEELRFKVFMSEDTARVEDVSDTECSNTYSNIRLVNLSSPYSCRRRRSGQSEFVPSPRVSPGVSPRVSPRVSPTARLSPICIGRRSPVLPKTRSAITPNKLSPTSRSARSSLNHHYYPFRGRGGRSPTSNTDVRTVLT